MSYRTIVVELQADRSPAARLTAAHAVARRFEANLIGLHVAAPPVMPMIWEGGGAVYIGPELLDAQHKAIEETRERMKALVDGIAPTDATVTWRAAEGDPALLVAQAAHAADLVITTRDQDSTSESAGLAQALVIAAGVPVLVLPPTYVDDGGRLALAGWDGSREATRAVHAALPFLQGARNTVLCAVGAQAAESLDDAAIMLGRHGVQVTPERIAASDRDAGEVLMARAAAHGADLLVMGAYGHTRLREFIFGGATRYALKEANLPVLFDS